MAPPPRNLPTGRRRRCPRAGPRVARILRGDPLSRPPPAVRRSCVPPLAGALRQHQQPLLRSVLFQSHLLGSSALRAVNPRPLRGSMLLRSHLLRSSAFRAMYLSLLLRSHLLGSSALRARYLIFRVGRHSPRRNLGQEPLRRWRNSRVLLVAAREKSGAREAASADRPSYKNARRMACSNRRATRPRVPIC